MGVVMVSVLRAEIHLVNIIKIQFDVQRIKIALSEVDQGLMPNLELVDQLQHYLKKTKAESNTLGNESA